MITLVRLVNWRAYGEVELQLEPGTTFLIGMNGVGKSSLMQAVRWAFDRAVKPNPEFIRKGERSASVEVTLRVDGSTLRIKRSLDLGTGKKPLKTPRSDLATSIDDREVIEDEVFDRLEEAWGADMGFVTRTAFLDMELSGPANGSELRSHLCRAYDLDNLAEHVRVFDAAVKQAVLAASAEHRAADDLERQIEATKHEIEELQALLRSSEARGRDLVFTLQAATEARSEAEQAQAALDARAQWDARWRQLAEAAMDFVGELPAGIDLRPLLRASLEAASRQRDEAREINARLRERLAVLEGALATLDAAEQDCPVCRRRLDDVSRAHAHQVQTADRTQISRELDEIDVDGPSTVVGRVQALLGEADRLGEPPHVQADAIPDVGVAGAAEQQVTEQREKLLGERGGLKSRIEAAQQELTQLEEQAEAASRASAAYRRLGALTAARDALKQTITEVLNTQIDPIGREVSARWDGVFPDRPGLKIDSDGNIKRTVAGGELEYSSFSAGEKTVARLLVKLATLIKTTRVPFCWIDEPLEHLDEKSRLVIARTLAQFGKERVLEQVFVTTYEQSLAVMVGQSTDEPHIEYLGTSQVVF